MQLGGVARVQLTQHLNCWQLGFHKNNPAHPALAQCAPLLVHRDRNRDFQRTGDTLMPAWGINHHGTRPGYVAKVVGMFSLGCPVRLHWKDHLEFIELLRADPRYVANPGFRFKRNLAEFYRPCEDCLVVLLNSRCVSLPTSM